MKRTSFVKKPIALLLILVAISVLPVLLSYSFYFSNTQLQGKNYGTLLTPAKQLSDWTDSRPVGFVVRKWTLLVVLDDCMTSQTVSNGCEQAAFLTHQVHQLLHKEYSRVQRYLIYANDATKVALQPKLDKQIWNYWQVSKQSAHSLTRMAQATSPVLLLVDPNGNIVIKYTKFHQPQKILADIKHLLKSSQIG